ERAEIVDIHKAPDVATEVILSPEARVFAALIYFGRADAPIHHAKVSQIEIGSCARSKSKLAVLSPASAREILGPQAGVHAAVNRPIETFSQNCAFYRRIS